MTESLAKLGHTVIGCARNEAAVGELKAKFGRPHRFDVVDVADRGKVDAWAAKVLADGGPPDLLLNNAAVVNQNRPLWKVPPEEFDRVIDINIKGVFYVARAFLPAMIQAGHGVIVNFSSGWGRSTSPEVAPYCATKYAIEGLTLALAQELPKGMAAVPLNPGIIDTDMLRSCFDGAESFPSPEQWAKKAVPFLLSLGPKDNGQSLSAP
jgi:NAD(P)-dependent dehydrogenase (short-subunit alcohol dehydrogenase family)